MKHNARACPLRYEIIPYNPLSEPQLLRETLKAIWSVLIYSSLDPVVVGVGEED